MCLGLITIVSCEGSLGSQVNNILTKFSTVQVGVTADIFVGIWSYRVENIDLFKTTNFTWNRFRVECTYRPYCNSKFKNTFLFEGSSEKYLVQV